MRALIDALSRSGKSGRAHLTCSIADPEIDSHYTKERIWRTKKAVECGEGFLSVGTKSNNIFGGNKK